MTIRKMIETAAALFTLGVAGTAAAEGKQIDVVTSLKEAPVLPSGLSLGVGGGVTGYAKQEARDYLNGGAYWEVRGHYGTRSYLGGELAYVGSSRGLSAPGLDSDAVLVSNGVEMSSRIQLPMMFGDVKVAPFLMSGLGYARLSVMNSDVDGTGIKKGANALTMPMGGGVGLAYQKVKLDLRFTYRKMFDEHLIEAPGDDKIDLQSWSLGLTAGYEL
jgi:hypothetical protein